MGRDDRAEGAARARGGQGVPRRETLGTGSTHVVDAVAMLQGSDDLARGHLPPSTSGGAGVRGTMSDDATEPGNRSSAWPSSSSGVPRRSRWAAPERVARHHESGTPDRARAPRPRSSIPARSSRSGFSPSPSTGARSSLRPTRSSPGSRGSSGRKVCVLAVDATVLAGTTGQVNMRKQNRIALWAALSAACR